jgi:hypothetical protein
MRRLGFLLLLITLMSSCDGGSYVDRITLVNQTDYDVLVDVRGIDDSSWLALGIANRNSQTVVEEVFDQGETWVFRFSYAGEALGQDRVKRSDLLGNRWRYGIPERVGQILKDKGYPPSAG